MPSGWSPMTSGAESFDAFVEVALLTSWQRWSTIRRTDAPEVYVNKVIVRTARRWSRRRWTTEVPAAELADRTVADSSDEIATRRALRDALGGLPPRQRAAVALRFVADLSEQQTAQVLGCSVGTVKSQTSRALAKLRAVPGLIDHVGRRDDK
jgi:RNA polymerase sigma-70 factor (sigma-E family)